MIELRVAVKGDDDRAEEIRAEAQRALALWFGADRVYVEIEVP